MREWVDAATWRDLHESFAHFAEGTLGERCSRLRNSSELHDVADAYGFTYPLEMEQQVQSYLAGYAPLSAATVRDPHLPGPAPSE